MVLSTQLQGEPLASRTNWLSLFLWCACLRVCVHASVSVCVCPSVLCVCVYLCVCVSLKSLFTWTGSLLLIKVARGHGQMGASSYLNGIHYILV